MSGAAFGGDMDGFVAERPKAHSIALLSRQVTEGASEPLRVIQARLARRTMETH